MTLATGIRLDLRQTQGLVLTPQLQQSIRLLQLSTLELNQEIEQALNENPLLERVDDPLASTLRIASDGSIQPAPTPAGEAPDEGLGSRWTAVVELSAPSPPPPPAPSPSSPGAR